MIFAGVVLEGTNHAAAGVGEVMLPPSQASLDLLSFGGESESVRDSRNDLLMQE